MANVADDDTLDRDAVEVVDLLVKGDLWERPVILTAELPQAFAVRADYLAARAGSGG